MRTGGPAFPFTRRDPRSDQIDDQFQGMTVRDYFAGQALQTVAAYPAEDVSTWTPYDFARHAYQISDAMLLERDK